jgi:hypothetical protein
MFKKDESLPRKKNLLIFFQLENNVGVRIYFMGKVSGRGNA